MSDLYILSASLIRHDAGTMATSIMQGYRHAKNEDEARGSFIANVMKEKPDFSVSQLLVMQIPKAHIMEVYDAMCVTGEGTSEL